MNEHEFHMNEIRKMAETHELSRQAVAWISRNGTPEEKAELKEAMNQLKAYKANQNQIKKEECKAVKEEFAKQKEFNRVPMNAETLNNLGIKKVGDTFSKDGQTYRVTKMTDYEENSYDGDAWKFGYSKYVWYINVTDETESQEETHAAVDPKKALEQCAKAGHKIENGTDWEGLKSQAVILWDTSNLYGSGDIALIANDRLYYIICNTGDGDAWENNSIPGVGYGWYCELTPKIKMTADQCRRSAVVRG